MSGSSFESSHHHQQEDSLRPRNSLPQMMKLTTTRTTTTTNHDHSHHNRPMNNNINPTTTPGFYARLVGSATHHPSMYLSSSNHHRNDLHSFQTGGIVGDDHIDDEDIIHTTTIVNIPQVTVVLEGRSICQRISLDKHASYHSLAKALRQMFVDVDATTGAIVGDHHHRLSLINSTSGSSNKEEEQQQQLDLSNAIPGYLIAYEDMEDDLLLAGDLNWKDFVRVAKRIRIIPVKANSRKGRGGA